jgi:hypothetical protein
VRRRSGPASWTWRRSGKRSARHWCGPNDGRGGGRCGVEADVEEEQERSVDPTAVGEAVIYEAPAVEAWRWSRSKCVGGGEMIVAKVRV